MVLPANPEPYPPFEKAITFYRRQQMSGVVHWEEDILILSLAAAKVSAVLSLPRAGPGEPEIEVPTASLPAVGHVWK